MKNINELEKAQFLQQLSMVLDGGISISDGLDVISSQTEDKEYANVLRAVKNDMDMGLNFPDALKKTGLYDEYMIDMLSIGQESGYLDKVVKELARYYNRMYDTKQRIKDALTYPSILIMMMLVVIIILINNILPLFKNVLSSMGISIASSVLVMLEIGKNLAIIAFVVLMCLFILALYILLTLRSKDYSYIKLLQRFFVTRKLAYDLAVVQFAYAFSLLLNSGISQEKALEICSEMCSENKLKEKIDEVSRRLKKGDSMNDCLLDTKIFKEMYNRLLIVGIKSGQFEKVMMNISEYYEKDMDESISKILDIIEPSLVMILSIIVGVILVSIMLPLAGVMVNL